MTPSEELAASRVRVGRLLAADGDHGYGVKAWWVGTFLDDEEMFTPFENMFDIPTPPPSSPSPAVAAPASTTPTPPPPPPPSPTHPSSPSSSAPTITPSLAQLAAHINQLPKLKGGLPSRNKLRKDDVLRGEVNRKTGYLRLQQRGGRLRGRRGDRRLFDEKMWARLCDSQKQEEEEGEAEVEAEEVVEGEEEEVAVTDEDSALGRRLQREERGLRSRR
ncbi:uncharacterized protein LTR77_003310 [Saxophila tyrrhenica]|uniref:Uncharacterized protein n=1 Tax=Saxophila tyrrhenica TaxID=1690608 RepID=A0AAV9PIT1_9PEZI|nr:hypothetical protein LTR77_003310 [Saxophila tyrrhenica]